jgi:glycosyltransferase involved in cell wall biosynthesis
LQRKFDALEQVFEVRVVGATVARSPTEDGVFALVPPFRPEPLNGALFYLTLPVRLARELRSFRPQAILTQSPYEAAAVLVGRKLAGSDARLVVDVHGDWRTLSRLYGSRLRALLRPLTDRIAVVALRRADAVRTVSTFTTSLARDVGVEPAAVFAAFMDLEPFLVPAAPLPEPPSAIFIGVLERYKDVDGLAAAWRLAAPRLPQTVLRVVGDGSRSHVIERLVRDLPRQTVWAPRLTTREVVQALDDSTVLVLPSRSEGMGRVIVEALSRGRPVIGTRVGGIPDLVADGVNGLVVGPRNPQALADAIVRVLSDRELAERLATAARPSAEPWLSTPEQYAERLRELVKSLSLREPTPPRSGARPAETGSRGRRSRSRRSPRLD